MMAGTVGPACGERPGRLGAWLLAIRPRTLGASVGPVIAGTALAAREGRFDPVVAACAMACAVLLQVAANLANDADDFERGADTGQRTGPLRVTQAGLLPAAAVRRGAWACLALATACGLVLVARGGWPILAAGIAAVLAALAYTGGPLPLGYLGLGDLLVFVFFGPVAVAGSYSVQAGTVSAAAWVVSLAAGAVATAVLAVNNVRDAATDAAAGKRTLAVRFGEGFGRRQYAALLAAAYLAVGGAAAAGVLPPGAWLSWVTVPRALRLAVAVRVRSGADLNPVLGATVELELLFCGLLAAGLWLA